MQQAAYYVDQPQTNAVRNNVSTAATLGGTIILTPRKSLYFPTYRKFGEACRYLKNPQFVYCPLCFITSTSSYRRRKKTNGLMSCKSSHQFSKCQRRNLPNLHGWKQRQLKQDFLFPEKIVVGS